MIVRDLTLKKTDYKGHPCWAIDVVCPCRPCYNCHDCGSFNGGRWHPNFACASNWNSGCPQPKTEPVHILNRQHRCKRCGVKVVRLEG